jgi:hypothetical protein
MTDQARKAEQAARFRGTNCLLEGLRVNTLPQLVFVNTDDLATCYPPSGVLRPDTPAAAHTSARAATIAGVVYAASSVPSRAFSHTSFTASRSAWADYPSSTSRSSYACSHTRTHSAGLLTRVLGPTTGDVLTAHQWQCRAQIHRRRRWAGLARRPTSHDAFQFQRSGRGQPPTPSCRLISFLQRFAE